MALLDPTGALDEEEAPMLALDEEDALLLVDNSRFLPILAFPETTALLDYS